MEESLSAPFKSVCGLSKSDPARLSPAVAGVSAACPRKNHLILKAKSELCQSDYGLM